MVHSDNRIHLIFLRRIIAIAAILIFLVLCLNPVMADGESGSNMPVKAGIFSFEGYHNMDEDGNLDGYGIEFLNLVSKYSHINFDYLGYERAWGEMLDMLENGEIDLVTSARMTPERAELFTFSLPIGRNDTILSTRVDENRFHRGNYRSYDGMTIGVLSGSSQNQALKEFAEENGFNYKVKEYKQSDELSSALQKGEIDAILSSNMRKAENEKTLDIIQEADIYAIVRHDDTDLISEVNYAIEQMDINEGDWKNVLFYKYYGPVYSSALSFSEREKEYIRSVQDGKKNITVTAFGGRAPYSYIENGELVGIIPDYFAKVMEVADLPYEVIVPEDSEAYFEILSTNGVNVILDSVGIDGINLNDEYRGFNTQSYLSTSLARVIRDDHKGSVKVVALSDALSKDLVVPEFLQGYTVETYPNADEAMRAVLDGKADVAYVYPYAAQLFINHDPTNSLYYSIVNGISNEFYMYVSEDTDHELVTILDKCIKQISSDTLNQLVSQYTAYTIGDMSIIQYLKANPVIMLLIFFIIVVIIVVIIVLFLRGLWSRKLLHTTEAANKAMGEQLAIVEGLSRDYSNVYAINEELGTVRIIKLEGFVPEGLDKTHDEENDYGKIVQRYIEGRVHPEDREFLAEDISLDVIKEHLEKNGEYRGSYRIIDNGVVHYFQYTYLKINHGDGSDGDSFILAGFRNIDELIQREQEQKNILSEALKQAQYANKSKTTFLNNMSHDIRTPMNAIIGFTQLAMSHLGNKEQIKSYLGKIMTAGNHLLSLINDVLDMSRIESGKVKIEEKETSIPEIMRDLKTIVQADVRSKFLDLHMDTLDVENEIIICDKLRLNQVLLNILSNAVKYTKPGGKVGFSIIQTSQAKDGYASYEFRVRDTGIGMSQEFLKHVFEPFEREQTSTVSGIQGTGLGLAITKNIVDLMGGQITVESEMGRGSEFIVVLRLKVADNKNVMEPLKDYINQRALVVDESSNNCNSVRRMLSHLGLRAESTTKGEDSVFLARSASDRNDPYSVYVIDYLMPGINGIEVIRQIKEEIKNPDTALFILTAYDWSDIEDEAKDAGVTAFCPKPIFLSEIRRILEHPHYIQEEEEDVDEIDEVFAGKRILLAEDNLLNQEIAETVLEGAGFTIDTVDDGSIAVKKMKDMPAGTYSLILMDVQMPIMNGYDATRAIRDLDDPDKASIPIVAMTANAFEEDRKEALDSGMNGYVAKPIDIDELKRTLKEILR